MNCFCFDVLKYEKRYIYNKEMNKQAVINSVHNQPSMFVPFEGCD